MDFVRRYVTDLAQSVLAPIWTWVMARSWGIRAGILAVILLIIGSFEFPDVPNGFLEEAYALRLATFAPGGNLPLNASTISLLKDTDQRLAKSVAGDLTEKKLDGVIMTPWSTAQAIFALDGAKAASVGPDKIVAYIRGNTAANCACWTELPTDKDGAQSVYISGWIMAALADLGVPPSPAELEYVLSKQNGSEGWWSSFSDSAQYQNASTYATAWIIIGLAEQKRHGLLQAGDLQKVNSAIEQASNWLLQHRDQSNARWKPYPNLPAAMESESISGLVVHALHMSGAVPTDEIDKEWLRSLPDRKIAASEVENNYFEIKAPTRAFIDHVVQIKLPWVLVATADAYQSGDIWTKGKALRWMEANITDKSVATADANDTNWWRAELLYALKRTLQRAG
ncbi:MAG TPA: hypothetical protein VNH44_14330 [Micropepsaceae bacterium]|nr:hypothetical protein [Micropepsaceae bacterium]